MEMDRVARPLILCLSVALIASAGLVARSAALEEGFTAKVVHNSQPDRVLVRRGLEKTPTAPPSGKKWCAVHVEFTLTGKDATVSMKKMRLLADGGQSFRAVAMAPPFDESFQFLSALPAQPGAVGQLYTLGDDDMYIYQRKGGGQIFIRSAKPVLIKFLFEVPTAANPRALELGEAMNLPLS